MTRCGGRVAGVLLTAIILTVSACAGGTPDRAAGGSARAEASSDDNGTGNDSAATPDGSTPPDDPRTGNASGGQAGRPPVPPVEWSDCGGGLQCGSVPVPVDYTSPGGPTLDIALIRVPAEGDRVGSVFVNPGGPGASGIDFVRGGFRLDPESAGRYDLVGFDPRGIGQSGPLTCSVARDESVMPDLSPDSVEEQDELDELAIRIVDDCLATDATLLPHLTTVNVARDLDRLRQAVGDDVLHYYGLSYGTLLALRYGQLFGDTVGHLVLDGVVDPAADLTTLLRQQAIAFESGFERLDERCGEVRCPTGGITGAFDRVRQRLEVDGPVGDVGASELVMASLLPAYSPTVLPAYAAALIQADGGNYTAIESLSDFFVGSVSFTAYAAFACADGRPPAGSDSWEQFAEELEVVAPRFGGAIANELRVCAFWPRPADDPVADVTGSDLATVDVPVLVVGNTGDAATPLVNAERVATLLPDARLVVVDSARHTAYSGSSCVRELVAEYLADRPPAVRSQCAAD